MHRSREWLFERIRRAKRELGLSGRELAVRFKVSRNTVEKALESPVPPKRKSPPPRKSVLEPVKGFIDAMLREDLDAPTKQKHTIPRIIERLAAEHDFEQARPTTLWDYVSKRRPEIHAESLEGRRHLDGIVPQAKRPGEEAEVDFADFWLDLAGQRRKCVLFTLRLSYSGKAVHRVFLCTSDRRLGFPGAKPLAAGHSPGKDAAMRHATTDPELLGLVRRFVTPGRRYLRLGGSLLRLSRPERLVFARELVQAASEITPAELDVLFEGGWRERKTASWLVVVAGRTEFRSRIGELLMASEGPYAGAAYCVTLATFGESTDADLLCRYLDRYLLRPDLDYDQGFALGALLHLDATLGSERASGYLAEGGLWTQWTDAPPRRDRDPQAYRQVVDQLCSFANECGEHFASLENRHYSQAERRTEPGTA
ncbi:DUF6000 family protein [Kitasatospora sp. NPDC001225]